VKYKTSICSYWKKQQDCPWEGRCKFAHGYDELRGSKSSTPNTASSAAATSKGPELLQELELLRAENKYLRLQVKFLKNKYLRGEEAENTANAEEGEGRENGLSPIDGATENDCAAVSNGGGGLKMENGSRV